MRTILSTPYYSAGAACAIGFRAFFTDQFRIPAEFVSFLPAADMIECRCGNIFKPSYEEGERLWIFR